MKIKLMIVVATVLTILGCSQIQELINQTGAIIEENKEALAQVAEGFFRLTATIEETALSVDGKTITDIIAVNPKSGQKILGTFSLTDGISIDIDKEVPWIIVFADRNQVGAEMLIGKLTYNTLDTVISNANSQNLIELGKIAFDTASALLSGKKDATAALSFTDYLEKLGVTNAAAEFFGEMDDVCLRYINPDINNNGTLDVLEEHTNFLLDFHNRFDMKKFDGNDTRLQDVKNTYLDANVAMTYKGTGLCLMIYKPYFSTTPQQYSYTFEQSVSVNNTLYAAGSAIEQSYTENTSSDYHLFFLDVLSPPEGKYTIKVDNEIFTFTNVKVSDFSGSAGFVMPFIKINVDDNDKITTIDWQFKKKGSDNTWSLASAEEVSMIVYGQSSLSLKTSTTNIGSVGYSFNATPEGTVQFADYVLLNTTVTEVNALTFSQMTYNPGLSYDDKLGMRFFATFPQY